LYQTKSVRHEGFFCVDVAGSDKTGHKAWCRLVGHSPRTNVKIAHFHSPRTKHYKQKAPCIGMVK